MTVRVSKKASRGHNLQINARGAKSPEEIERVVKKAVEGLSLVEDGKTTESGAATPEDAAQAVPAQSEAVDAITAKALKKPEKPFYTVEIEGKRYRLCLEYNELADAELAFAKQGQRVNLLLSLAGGVNLRNTRSLFAAGLWYYHPEITYTEACKLLTVPYGLMVGAIIASALTEGLPEPIAAMRAVATANSVAAVNA